MIVEHNQSTYYKSPYPTTNTGDYDNAFKFNGKELDAATGMYYYGSRYYDPRISIFISVDPLVEKTFEPYSYVGNNPINFIDPTGNYKVKPEDQKRFSVLTGYLKNGISEILDNPKIMDGLRKYGRFTDEQIKNNIVTFGQGINIEFKDETSINLNANGWYAGNNTIYIHEELAFELQNAKGDEKLYALTAIMATILHESVHAGDNENSGPNIIPTFNKFGYDVEEREKGYGFEYEVFWDGDYDIGSDRKGKKRSDGGLENAKLMIERKEANGEKAPFSLWE